MAYYFLMVILHIFLAITEKVTPTQVEQIVATNPAASISAGLTDPY